MCNQSEWTVREAFQADDKGDVIRLLEFVDLDRFDREQLAKIMRLTVDLGLWTELEAVVAAGDKVMLVVHASRVGRDEQCRSDDRTYHVATVQDGLIVGLHTCRDRDEARSLIGIG